MQGQPRILMPSGTLRMRWGDGKRYISACKMGTAPSRVADLIVKPRDVVPHVEQPKKPARTGNDPEHQDSALHAATKRNFMNLLRRTVE